MIAPRFTLAFVALAVCTLSWSGCQQRDAPHRSAEPSINPTPSQAPSQVDIWERSRQCSVDADRFGARAQKEFSGFTEARLTGWISHYNTRDQRCYVELSFLRPKVKKGEPLVYRLMFNAIEGSDVAGDASGPLDELNQQIYCMIPDGSRGTKVTDCRSATQFIDQHMTE